MAHGQQGDTKQDGEELVNLMQPPPRIKKKGKKGKKGSAADAVAQLGEFEAKKDEVRNRGTFSLLNVPTMYNPLPGNPGADILGKVVCVCTERRVCMTSPSHSKLRTSLALSSPAER